MRTPTISQLRNGPPTIDLMTAAAILRIGRTKAYRMAAEGTFPVTVIRIGASYRVPVAALLELLGIAEHPAGPGPATTHHGGLHAPVA